MFRSSISEAASDKRGGGGALEVAMVDAPLAPGLRERTSRRTGGSSRPLARGPPLSVKQYLGRGSADSVSLPLGSAQDTKLHLAELDEGDHRLRPWGRLIPARLFRRPPK